MRQAILPIGKARRGASWALLASVFYEGWDSRSKYSEGKPVEAWILSTLSRVTIAFFRELFTKGCYRKRNVRLLNKMLRKRKAEYSGFDKE